MSCVLHVMLIIGIVDYSLQVTFIIPYLEGQFVSILSLFHSLLSSVIIVFCVCLSLSFWYNEPFR